MSKRKRQDGVNLCQVECRRAEIEIRRGIIIYSYYVTITN